MSAEGLPLGPLRSACRICVVIPARDEAPQLRATLEAFARQRLPAGASHESFEIVIFANGCTDATAGVARAFAAEQPHLAIDVHEAPAGAIDNVGDARGIALDAVAHRFIVAGKPEGIVASTDADTLVDDGWLEAVLDEMSRVDAIGGYVTLSDDARDRMLAPQRLYYDREIAYRGLLGAIEDRFDPRPYDPAPRHDAFVGANFAVSAAAYARAGGLPRLPFHEDVALAAALDRSGARIRHSFRARAYTSERRLARVRDGFGDFLADLARMAADGDPHLVRAAAATIESARARFWLRAADDRAHAASMRDAAAELLGIDRRTIARIASISATEGERWSRLSPLARQSRYANEPIESVIATFRRALAPVPLLPSTDAGLETG